MLSVRGQAHEAAHAAYRRVKFTPRNHPVTATETGSSPPTRTHVETAERCARRLQGGSNVHSHRTLVGSCKRCRVYTSGMRASPGAAGSSLPVTVRVCVWLKQCDWHPVG